MTSRKKGCEGKVPHETREAAHKHMHKLIRTTGAIREILVIYCCRYCKKFHVGHRSGSSRRR